MTTECNDADPETTRDANRFQAEADEPASIAVVRAVAATSGRSPIAAKDPSGRLDPLAESVDPEALDRLFEPRRDAAEDGAVVEFQYSDHRVTVKSGETLCVTVQ